MTLPIKRKATLEDAVYIANNLREQDLREVLASAGGNPRDALVDSFLASEECLVWEVEGRPVCIAGVARHPIPGPSVAAGIPWMLGTPETVRYAKSLVQQGRGFVSSLTQRFPVLFNFVHAENTVSIAWLKRLGFQFGPTIPEYGAAKQPFILFYRYSNV